MSLRPLRPLIACRGISFNDSEHGRTDVDINLLVKRLSIAFGYKANFAARFRGANTPIVFCRK